MNAAKNVIIDCDPGIDDCLALMLALKSPELNILGITVVCGNVPVELGVKNARLILEKMNRTDIPVVSGCKKPLIKNYISAQDTHGDDGIGNSGYSPQNPYAAVYDAPNFILNTLSSHENVSVIALGPLTNIACAISKNRTVFEKIDMLVSMGGSFKSHGNCSPVAEYNYWCDPHAANQVYNFYEEFSKKYPDKKIHMTGLDVTRKIVLTPNHLEYASKINLETASFIRDITRFYFDFHWEYEHITGCVINDPLTVAYFIRPELLSGFDTYTDIATEGICEGMSVCDSMNFYRKPANSHVLIKADDKAFMAMFFSRIFDISEEEAAAHLCTL